ncbi:MAG: FAD-dependent oxidoreductase [Candidatus Omnitrophota bacterium]
MGDILIIGGGFAGQEAARFFARNRYGIGQRQVIVVDAKSAFDFLPLLPDVAGGRIAAKNATVSFQDYFGRLNINFQQDKVVRIDVKTKDVFLETGRRLSYEYLLLAAGSVTNYYSQEFLRSKSFELKTVSDVLKLAKAVEDNPDKKILIVGGGYTGVEIASNLALFLRRRKVKKYHIHIIERNEDLLSSLPVWMQDYCRLNLCAYRVNVHCAVSIKEVTDCCVKLSNNIEFDNYLLVWTAGVAAPPFTSSLEVKKDRLGRLFVDEHMKVTNYCYAAGDLTCFQYANKPIRMAVQFSVAQGRIAAKNILRSITGRKLLKYRPCDSGFLVPLANKKACGKVLFFRVFGIFGWFLHYGMCIYRSSTIKNRFGVFCDIFLKMGR